MVAFSLLFRYADFVDFLGGTEFILGWIVGVGMIGSLLMRLAQGVGIDRYGARWIWLISSAAFALGCLGHLLLTRVDSPAIFLLRMVLNTSVAGVFGASITYISTRAPAHRMAEVIGMLGTSGFVGMVAGTMLGDRLFAADQIQRWHLDRMFLVATGLTVCSFCFAWFATRGQSPPELRRQPSVFWLLKRYHPGPLLLVGIAMGVGLGLPQTFLRPFTADLGIARIAVFFSVYAPTAFITRLLTRRLPDRVGTRPMILVGLCCLATSMLMYLVVRTEWQLAAPGLLQGMAHALLFPSVIAGGSSSFPARYRGLATTLMLATFDAGNLIGAPMIGGMLRYAGRSGLPRYPTMFVTVAALFLCVTIYFALSGKNHTTTDSRRTVRRRSDRRPHKDNGDVRAEDTASRRSSAAAMDR